MCLCLLVLSEVSCKTLEGVDGLKKLIYQVALSMKDNSSSAFGSKLLGRLVSEVMFLVMNHADCGEKASQTGPAQTNCLLMLATHQIIIKSKLILKTRETTDMRTVLTDFFTL